MFKSAVVKQATLFFSSRSRGIFSNLSSIGQGTGGITGASAFFFFFPFFLPFFGLAGLEVSGASIDTFFPAFFASAAFLVFSSSSSLLASSSSSFNLASSSSSSGLFFFLAGRFFFFFGAFASSFSFQIS